MSPSNMTEGQPAEKSELDKNLDFFINNQKSLNERHNDKILLIYHQQVIGAFADYESAYDAGLGKYPPGEFSLIPCRPGPEAYTVGFGNLAYFAKPTEI